MNDFLLLTRLYIQQTIGSFKYAKNKKNRRLSGTVYILLIGLYLVGCMTAGAVGSARSYTALGIPEMTIYSASIYAVLMSGFLGIMRGAVVTKNIDAEMLLSLPLNRTAIIYAKSAGKYLFQLLFAAVFVLPYLIAYIAIAHAPFIHLLRGLLVLLLIPMLAVGLEYLLNCLFYAIGSKLRNPQSVSSALSIVFLIAFLFFNTKLSGSVVSSTEEIAAAVNSFPPGGWMMDYVCHGVMSGLINLLLLLVVPFVIGVSLYARIFGVNRRSYHSSGKKLSFESLRPLRTLLRIERRRYFGSSAYFVNTIFGIVLMPVLMIVLIFMPDDGEIAQLINSELLRPYLALVVSGVFSMLACTSNISASSISIEGKQFWQLKCLPLDEKDIFPAKILFAVIVSGIPAVIFSLLTAVILGVSFMQLWIPLLLPLLTVVCVALSGFWINLRFPKLDWSNEAAVVKQSMAAGVSLGIGFLLVAVPAVFALLMITGKRMGSSLIALIWIVFDLLVAAAYALLIARRGMGLFSDLY